jgi:hypothetical protein
MGAEIMTIDDVKLQVQHIQEAKHDDESAHGMEDSLWEDVLKSIAHGAKNARELATEALKTKNIKFSRWYA